MSIRTALCAAMITVLSGVAKADGEVQDIISRADSERLDQYVGTRRTAMEEAKAGGAPHDVATLEKIASRPALPFDVFDMTGDWHCRTIKVGGLASLVVYDWFGSRITDDRAGSLDKLSGSQRTRDRFFTDSGMRLTSLATYFVAGEIAPPYGAGPQTDQVGYAFRSGEQRRHTEFPAPTRESKLDILEFRRAGSIKRRHQALTAAGQDCRRNVCIHGKAVA